MRVLVVVLCGWLALGLSAAWAYEEIQVPDGGTIAGMVTITEGIPIPKGFNLITFPDRSIAVEFPLEPAGAFFKSFLSPQTEDSKTRSSC